MSFAKYQLKAKEFIAYDETQPFNYLLPALAEEVGELQGIYAKNFRKHGSYNLDYEQATQVKSELGDILWNLALIAREEGWTLTSVAEGNIDKLQKRKENNEIASIQRRES